MDVRSRTTFHNVFIDGRRRMRNVQGLFPYERIRIWAIAEVRKVPSLRANRRKACQSSKLTSDSKVNESNLGARGDSVNLARSFGDAIRSSLPRRSASNMCAVTFHFVAIISEADVLYNFSSRHIHGLCGEKYSKTNLRELASTHYHLIPPL